MGVGGSVSWREGRGWRRRYRIIREGFIYLGIAQEAELRLVVRAGSIKSSCQVRH
jgi:hypothetical protein